MIIGFYENVDLVCNLAHDGETGSVYHLKKNVFVTQTHSLLCGDEQCAVQGIVARDRGCPLEQRTTLGTQEGCYFSRRTQECCCCHLTLPLLAEGLFSVSTTIHEEGLKGLQKLVSLLEELIHKGKYLDFLGFYFHFELREALWRDK